MRSSPRAPSTRAGNIHALSLADMGFTYRHSEVPADWILTEALFQGTPAIRRRS